VRVRALVASLMLLLGLGGCRKAATPVASGPEHYPIRGVVVSTDAANGEVTLRHGAIPGLMEAMTMPSKRAVGAASGRCDDGDAAG
jgi:protein SCO1/2